MIHDLDMADLEKLALRRDRGYLLRLVLALGAACLIAPFLFGWLTGSGVGGCMADGLGTAKPENSHGMPPSAAPR
jgi:hypothetical protein